METWLRISLLLCAFGFCREMRPSEPFAIEYISNSYNITTEQVIKDVYPLGTYAILAQLVIIFLITDMLRYKPIIVVSACSGIIFIGFIIWTETITAIQIDQFFYGTLIACEVAYYSYIYAMVAKDRYQIVTGHSRAAILCGKFMGGMLGQLLLSTGTTTIRELLYISFGSQLMSLCIAIALPAASTSFYFYADQQKIDKSNNEQQEAVADISLGTPTVIAKAQTAAVPRFSCRNATRLLFEHTVSAYSKPVVVKWSIWWAVATSAQMQALIFVQFLWAEIDPNHEHFYNGAVEATVTLLGAVGAMTAGLMNSTRHKQWHWCILIICSLLMGAYLIISAITKFIILSYVMYILFGMTYSFVITIASSTVAENLSDDSFGLIFGINSLASVVLQSLLTVFVIADVGLGYGPRDQYIVYGGYFIALACFYCMAAMLRYLFKCSRKDKYILQ